MQSSSLLAPLALVLLGGCAGATCAPASPARTEVTEAELATLRETVPALVPGTRRAAAMAALGVSLDGLPVIGDGPEHAVTETYPLRGANVLWLTWDARDPADVVLVRAVVWNQATDPMPPPPPYPPPDRH